MDNADPPTAGGAGAADGEVQALADRLGIALPAECVAGVRHHVALLDRHWGKLRTFVPPRA